MGFAVGPWKLGGFTLGNVTATLLAGVLIGQLGITVGGPIKSAFFLMFLFAVGFGVGPQFFRGLGKEGPRQIVFSLVVLSCASVVPVLCAMAAGLDVGYAAGLYAGSQTISAAIGVATDQIDRLGLSRRAGEGLRRRRPDRLRRHLHLRHDRLGHRARATGPEADWRRPGGGLRRVRAAAGRRRVGSMPASFSAYRAIELRAYRFDAAVGLTGRPVRELFPGLRVFVERVRRGDALIDARRRHGPPARRRRRHLGTAPDCSSSRSRRTSRRSTTRRC